MDASEIKNIFRKFYRAPRAEQSAENGSGLGLAIVEEIVVQHGGSIKVESRVNEGSRFTLLLPRAAGRAMTTA
jgi:signal transduction histidine kinase